MYLVKTVAGQQAFKERHADLSPRLRSAFLQFDGQRSLAQVLESVSGLGVTQDELLALVEREWLVPREMLASGVAVASVAQARPVSAPTQAERYHKAYPLAVSITAGLGLKGFRLNLAVEAAMGYEQLVALAPRIREVAAAASYAPLHQALFGESPQSVLTSA